MLLYRRPDATGRIPAMQVVGRFNELRRAGSLSLALAGIQPCRDRSARECEVRTQTARRSPRRIELYFQLNTD